MLKWIVGLAALVVVVAATVVVVRGVARRSERGRAAGEGAGDLGAPPALAPPPAVRGGVTPAAETPVRRQVREVVERAARATTPAQLPAYLEGLLARARAQGRVTALESEVGMEMIQRMGGDVRTQMAFAAKLNALAEELRHEPAAGMPVSPAEARARLDELAGRLGRAKDEPERQSLVRRYMEEAARLDPAEQPRAMTRLNELAGAPSAAPPPAAREIASEWAAIEGAQGAARETAIRSFMETVSRLPPDEQIPQMQRLDELVRANAEARAP